jgi:glucose-1-phosphate thymidylyltransferase
MKIIVPMAGRGSRLASAHTLTIPKPLIPVAGKPIVHRLVEDIAGVLNQTYRRSCVYVIHESFGKKVEDDLIAIAREIRRKRNHLLSKRGT